MSKALIPFPTPWKNEEESIPNAIPGKNIADIRRKVVSPSLRAIAVSAWVKMNEICGAKMNIAAAMMVSMRRPSLME